MQSFLQYRRLKRRIERRIKPQDIKHTDHVNDDPRSAQNHAAPNSANTGHGSDCRSPANSSEVESHDKLAHPTDVFIVGFDGPDDSFNPQKWSQTRKWAYTTIVGMTGFVVSGAAAFDTEIAPQAAKYYGVSEEVELLSTALYMIALGLGSLISAPFSETVGRNPVYIICLTAFALFTMGAGLAHNIQTQLVCRFFAALFGCPPLTTFGGSMADMWTPLDRTYVFPVVACMTFISPFLAPMVSDFIATSPVVSWRWTEWITMILTGWVVAMLFFIVPETYAPVLLAWKAKHLRTTTGDERYRAAAELKPVNLGIRLLRSITRPIKFLLTEPIVDLFSLYLVIVYIILFGFLPGFDFIFGKNGIYGFDQEHTGLFFIPINIGFLIAMIPIRPLYKRFKRKLAAAQEAGMDKVEPEERLLFAMMGAPILPVSIFWMGWSSWPNSSYWSPIVASVFFEFATMAIFISCYAYIIDSFEAYAASALVGMTVTRYCIAGKSVESQNFVIKLIVLSDRWSSYPFRCMKISVCIGR